MKKNDKIEFNNHIFSLDNCMTLNQLKLLLELKKHAFNLTLASNALNVVQSAGTRQLQMLESELGIPLFLRKGKRLIGFTEQGKEVLEQANVMLSACQNIKNIAANFHSPEKGEIKIACTHMQAKYFLPSKLMSFRRSHPQVQIHLEQGTPDQLVEWLREGKVDLTISTEGLSEATDLSLFPCYQWHHILVLPHSHPLLNQPLSLETISKHSVLTYLPGITGHDKIIQAFFDQGLKLDISLYATDSDIIKKYVTLGLGIGIIGEMAFDPKQDSELVSLSLAKWIPHSITQVAILKQRLNPVFVMDFIKLLSSEA